jgi:hypothetical protein
LDSTIVIGIVVGILVVIVAFQTIQLIGVNSRMSGAAVASGGIDMTGWTEDEKMNYEHHGVIPARFQQSQQQIPKQGVGGC